MKHKSILILAVMLLATTLVSASEIVSKEITWSEYPFLSSIGIGDYVETTTYDDGYQEGVYHRGSLSKASIFFAPYKVTIPSGQNSVTWEYILEGQSCSLTGLYSFHKVDWYFDGVLYYSENLGTITCGTTATYQTKDYREAGVGQHTITLKETMWNNNGMVVTETRLITLVIEPNENPTPTPTPTPQPSSGTISITSNPSGATVRVDSIEKGYTPISFSMPPGNYIVSTSLAGYKTDNYGMTVSSGQTSTHNINLQPISTPTPTPYPTTPQPTPTSTTPTPTTPTPTSTTPNPTQTTPSPTGTQTGTPTPNPTDCPNGYMWDDSYKTCRPILDMFASSGGYILIGIVLIMGIFLLKRKDLKW